MMDVLKRVENQVGHLEIWPTYILLHMFVDKPNDEQGLNFKKKFLAIIEPVPRRKSMPQSGRKIAELRIEL
jgi:hypothetical protein